jgi:ComEC/Rec2-related protein
MSKWNWPYWCVFTVVLVRLAGLASLILLLPLGVSAWPLLLLAGWTHWQAQLPEAGLLAPAQRLPVQVVAEVIEPAQVGPTRLRFVVRVHHWLDRVDGPESCWLVEAPGDQMVPALGELWYLQGQLVGLTPAGYPGDFDSQLYWKRRGVEQSLRLREAKFLRPARPNGLLHWRYRLTQRLMDHLPPQRAGLLCAVVYGDGSRLTPQLADEFRRAGASHLLVASGTNVAVLVAWLTWMGARLGWGPRRCCWLGLWLVPLYVILSGAAPAMLRAGVMGWLALLARWTGYSLSLGRSLMLGTLGVLLWDSNYLFDVGFQLSFAAVASLAWLMPWLEAWIPGRPTLQASLACLLGVMPISLLVFHTVQPLSPFSNLWLGPLVEGLLPVGLGLSVIEQIWPWLGQTLIGWLDPWLWLIELSTQWWAQLSPQLQVPHHGELALAGWLFLMLLIRLGPGLVTVSLCSAPLWVWLIWPQTQPGLELRWFWLGPAPALWISQDGSTLVLLSHPSQAGRCANLGCVQTWVLDHSPYGRALWGQGWLEHQPQNLIYCWRRYRFCLGQEQGHFRLTPEAHWSWLGEEPRRLEKGQAWRLGPSTNWQIYPWSKS